MLKTKEFKGIGKIYWEMDEWKKENSINEESIIGIEYSSYMSGNNKIMIATMTYK